MSRLLLLGTGSADGWPNPFCRCASCLGAAAAGEVRGQSAALLDGTVMLDCGPEAPRAAVRAGVELAGVRLVLLTHSHPDHTSPAALLWRSWTRAEAPLVVAGPPDAVEAYTHWVGPDDPVALRPVRAGDEVELAGYRCRALPAAHEVATVLWDITCPDGSRLLYATDTGPLPAQTLQAARGRAYDLLVLEETFGDVLDHGTHHLDLRTFPAQLAALRGVGAVSAGTRVVATHLSHHNPPTAQLAARLLTWGVEVHPDGTTVSTRGPATDVEPAPPDRQPRRTLVLGGARSGKSTHAEQLLADRTDVVYVATAGRPAPVGGPSPDGTGAGAVRTGLGSTGAGPDTDFAARVALHRARRPVGWTTLEQSDLLGPLATDGPPLLVDCLALWCTAALDRAGAWEQQAWLDGTAQQRYRRDVEQLLRAWRTTPRQVVAVSNEVGSGVVPATWSGRLFRDELGRLNTAVAAATERVDLVVAGTVRRLKG